MRYLGCHVSASGGLDKALERGEALGVNTIQVHASPPQKWNVKPFPKGIEARYLDKKKTSIVEKVFFHAIYLINLASADQAKIEFAKLSLINDLDFNSRIEGDGVIFHVGSMKDQLDNEAGLRQVAETINEILAASKNKARLLLEVAAGSGKIIGSKLEELRFIYDLIKEQARVGFALDTQHMFASGYDLKDHLNQVIEEVDKIFTLDKVWAIHLNDSMTELNSKKDRHQNLGDGLIGNDSLSALLHHPKLSNIPFILETPDLKTEATAKIEVEKLKNL